MINFNKAFKTETLHLRPMKFEDEAEMFALTSIDPEQWYYFTVDLSDRAGLKAWVREGVENTERLALTAIEIESGRIVGATSIANISKRDRRAEIGWTWMGKPYQGKGINARIKLVLLQYLFEECDFQRVEIKTDALNMAARKAVAKIGFVEEGVLRSHTQVIRGRRRDSIFYGVLRDEWPEMKTKNQKLIEQL